jgi:hypothetical protein
MNIFNKWIIGVTLSFAVIGVSLCGTADNKANAEKIVPATAPIDLSGVNWTELARFMYGRCGEYHDLAIAVGWTEAHWKKLSFVMYRESRCNTMSFNKKDPNGGSRGLIQINGFWCKPSKYNKSGWLQAQGILNTCEDLFIPEVNLRAGLAMWNYSQQRNKCGWQPWATRC